MSSSKLSHNPIAKASQTSGHMNVTKLQRFGAYFFLCVELKLPVLASSTQWDSTGCACFSYPAARRDFRFILLRIGQLRLLFSVAVLTQTALPSPAPLVVN